MLRARAAEKSTAVGDEGCHGKVFGDLLRLVGGGLGLRVVAPAEGDFGTEGEQVGLRAALALTLGVFEADGDGFVGAIEVLLGEPGAGDDEELHAAPYGDVRGLMNVD